MSKNVFVRPELFPGTVVLQNVTIKVKDEPKILNIEKLAEDAFMITLTCLSRLDRATSAKINLLKRLRMR